MAAQELAAEVGVAPACRGLGVSRATFYRRQRPTPGHQQPRPTPARALCVAEREHIVDVLTSARYGSLVAAPTLPVTRALFLPVTLNGRTAWR